MVTDTEASFCAYQEDPETIIEVDDISFINWVNSDLYSASKEPASLSIDVGMSDYVIIDTP